jgi:hypothetical protein
MSYISVIFSFLISLNNKISKNKKIIFFITCFFVCNSVIGSLFILKIDNNSYEIQKNHKKEYCNIVKKSNFYFQKDTLFHLSEGKDEIFSYILCVKQEENIKWNAPLKDSILNFIYRFDKISSEEFIKCYSTFNQKVTGKLRYQNQIYEYEVNAGGWITLNSKEKSILLGSKNKKDTLSNFISVYYCDEDWN